MNTAVERAAAPKRMLDLSAGRIWRESLPAMEGDPVTRWILRSLLWFFAGAIIDVRGVENISPDRDPFVLAPNHNQKLEAILMPALMIFLRGGRRIHFLSDWNFRMIPGLASVLRRAGTIILMNKSAKPRILNVLKPLFDPGVPGWVRAKQTLEQGRSVGVYPEGTINRHPTLLLKGYSGAARLSLMAQVPVVPVGIRFPGHPPGQPIRERERMWIDIGEAIQPPPAGDEPSLAAIRAWHNEIMLAISRLSQKEWQPKTKRRLS